MSLSSLSPFFHFLSFCLTIITLSVLSFYHPCRSLSPVSLSFTCVSLYQSSFGFSTVSVFFSVISISLSPQSAYHCCHCFFQPCFSILSFCLSITLVSLLSIITVSESWHSLYHPAFSPLLSLSSLFIDPLIPPLSSLSDFSLSSLSLSLLFILYFCHCILTPSAFQSPHSDVLSFCSSILSFWFCLTLNSDCKHLCVFQSPYSLYHLSLSFLSLSHLIVSSFCH